MRRQQVMWLGATVALAVVLGSIVDLHGQPAVKGRATAVATIQLSEVLAQLDEVDDMNARMRVRRDEIVREKVDREREINVLTQDLEVLDRDSVAAHEAEMKRAQKAIQLEAWMKFQEARLQIDQALMLEDIYRKIVETIGVVAEQDGWDLVLYYDDIRSVQGKTVQQVQSLIALRKLVYASDDLNISDRVIQVMNNNFQNRPAE